MRFSFLLLVQFVICSSAFATGEYWERSLLPDLRGEGVEENDPLYSGREITCSSRDSAFHCVVCNTFFEANGEPA